MWESSRSVLGVILVLLFQQLWSQDNRYFVYLADKVETPYSINSPEDFLSAAAIDRRESQDILIDELDLPVNPAYIAGITDEGATVYYRSKWFNGAIVEMDSSTLEKVSNLVFVDSIAWIGKPKSTLSKTRSSIELSDLFDPSPYSTAGSGLQTGMLNVDKMHDDGYRGDGMTIAVLDGGFIGAQRFSPMAHLFKDEQYLGGEDLTTYGGNPFRYSGHGTAVLSTIAAKADSLTGTAYKANFLLYVTEDVGSESPIE